MDNTQILQETTHQNAKHCETNVDLVSYEGAIETSWQSQPAIELKYFIIDSYLACLAQVICYGASWVRIIILSHSQTQ